MLILFLATWVLFVGEIDVDIDVTAPFPETWQS